MRTLNIEWCGSRHIGKEFKGQNSALPPAFNRFELKPDFGKMKSDTRIQKFDSSSLSR